MKQNRLTPGSNKFWESSRMILPEHKSAILKQREELGMSKAKGPKRPTRDDFELEEIGERLAEAHREETELTLLVWNWEHPVQGKVVTMDARTKMVHIQKHGDITKVPFIDIMKVESS